MPGPITKLEASARAKDDAHKQKLDAEVERRRAQELDSARGENVWFSRRIHDGHLYHWALFTHGRKFELRLPTREKYKEMLPNGQLVGSIVPSFQYEVRIADWSLKEEMMDQREESISNTGKPHAYDYYICQIGWTKLSKSQVEEECKAVGASFGVYVLGFHDCQTFLKEFAKRIIKEPEDCALDYPWFAQSTETPYHELQRVPADANIRAFHMYLKTAVLGGAGATVGVGYAAYERQDPMQAKPTSDSKGQNTDTGNGEDGDCCDCCGCC